jgi:hypothetical protein
MLTFPSWGPVEFMLWHDGQKLYQFRSGEWHEVRREDFHEGDGI